MIAPLSFRTRLFLGSSIAVAVLALVTAGVAVFAGRARLAQSVERDFSRAPEMVHERLAKVYRRFQAATQTWSEDKRYSSWLGRASAAEQGAHPAPADLKAAHDGLGAIVYPAWEEFRVTNDEGVLLVDMARVDAVGEDLTADPAVRRALGGEEVLRIRGHLLEMARAIRVEGSVRGVMIAADPIQPIRDDLESALRLRVELAAGAGGEGGVRDVLRDGDTWLETTVPIAGLREGEVIGHATLRRNLSAELRPVERDLLLAIGVATGVGLIVSLALSLLLARFLAAPVRALSAATLEIGRGNYDYRVEVRSSDELGQLAAAFNAMAAGLGQRVFFESALRRYVAGPVVEQLIRDPTRLRLGGEKRQVTVLFFDVADFTSLSESLPADQLVALCNAYLDRLVEVIFRNSGTLDKFIGDAIMAFWGAPLDQPDQAAMACRAAVELQRALAEFLSSQPDPRVKRLTARVGVHTGVAALGNLGSTQVMSYTAMGDTVNVASRLEGVNKLYGTRILASEDTVAAAPGVACRELDRVRVKGRAQPLRIFEVLLQPDAVAPEALAAYSEGLALYRAARFSEAATAFRRARSAGDGACATTMAERCAQLATSAPPSDWDATFNLTAK